MSEVTGDNPTPPMRSAPTFEKRGIIASFAHNTVAANLVMAVMLIGGFAAVTQLTAQVFPTVDPGIVTVTVPYPGATPTEVAEGITRRVEEAVRPVMLTGNVFTTLHNIDAIGNDIDMNQGGGCGKAGQMPLPVSNGSPHIRIRNCLISGA